MKIKFFFTIIVILFQVQVVLAQDLKSFLKSCAWGVIGGASAGIVSLAFTDKPSESWNNVAKGASLGLYVGIGYGLYQINRSPTTYQQPDFAIIPNIKEGKLNGAQIIGTVLDF